MGRSPVVAGGETAPSESAIQRRSAADRGSTARRDCIRRFRQRPALPKSRSAKRASVSPSRTRCRGPMSPSRKPSSRPPPASEAGSSPAPIGASGSLARLPFPGNDGGNSGTLPSAATPCFSAAAARCGAAAGRAATAAAGAAGDEPPAPSLAGTGGSTQPFDAAAGPEFNDRSAGPTRRDATPGAGRSACEAGSWRRN